MKRNFLSNPYSETHIIEQRNMKCSANLTEVRVRDFFAGHGAGETVRLRLHVPLQIPGLGIKFRVGREVMARMRPYSDKHDIVEIEWDPQNRLLPRFNAILTVEPEGNVACRLILNGVYAPPMSWIGRLFDRIVGRRLARTTALDLLERIGNSVEPDSHSGLGLEVHR